MILVGACSFQAGTFHGALRETGPATLSIPVPAVAAPAAAAPVPTAGSAPVAAIPSTCMFVGSRNSDKYHLPKCAAAKRIKPENLVCFASEDDAKKKGYVAGCLK